MASERRFGGIEAATTEIEIMEEAFARLLAETVETVETKVLGDLLEHRLKGPIVSRTEMGELIDAMIKRKRLSLSKQCPPRG